MLILLKGTSKNPYFPELGAGRERKQSLQWHIFCIFAMTAKATAQDQFLERTNFSRFPEVDVPGIGVSVLHP